MKTYDIAICGAGLVGQCLALALAQKTNKNILLFDAKSNTPLTKQPLDTRTLALNKFSQQLFEQLAIWPELISMAEPIKQIQISERGAFAKAFLKASDIPTEALGYVIEIADLQSVLQRHLSQMGDRLMLLEKTQLKHFEQNDSDLQLQLQQGDIVSDIHCQWLIAADSSQSFIRRHLQIPCQHRDYQQTAIVSVIQLKHSANQQAFERFLKDGVIAMLPLTQNRCGSVWVMDNGQAENYIKLSDKDYLAALQQQFGQQLGNFIALGPRQHYPLQLLLAEQVVNGHVCLIGNAAHTINPIGAQGLNLGLHDVACLLDFFKGHLSENQLSEKLLTRNHQLAQFSDGAARIFGLDFCPINCVRQLGLLMLEHSFILKKYFCQCMMGY